MKKISFVLIILLACTTGLSAQQLMVNTTRFVGGDLLCGGINSRYAISTRDGGILFVGSTSCWGGGDIPNNPPDSAVGSQQNILIVKMDSSMQLSWVKAYGGSRSDIAMSACQTADGGYGILASTESHDRDVTGNHSVFGVNDLWLVRIDSLGNLLWEKCFGGPGDEQAASIAVTADNGFILFGGTNMAGGDVPFIYSASYYNWFVVKTDSMGNKQWANTLGGSGEDYPGGSIFLADTGYYLISGSSSTDHDCTDTGWHAGVNTGYDYYILKLDTAGHKVWCKSFGGSLTDICNSAIWDSRDSSIVMTGNSYSTNYMVTGHKGTGNANTWIVKTDKNGNLIWETSLGDNGYNDNEGKSLTMGPSKGYLALTQMDSGTIHAYDNRLFLIDSAGNMFVDKVFGGLGNEKPTSILPYKHGYAATGFTSSLTFTEGVNFGRIGTNIDVSISYINYWPLALEKIYNAEKHLELIPNPTHNKVRIILPVGKGVMNITNAGGQKVYTQKIKPQQKYIDVNTENWAKGGYMVMLACDDGTVISAKLIIN